VATALTPQTDVTSGEAYRGKKSIKNPIKPTTKINNKNPKNKNKKIIKSETSDSFVNHFDGHFAYLKTLDFYFNQCAGALLNYWTSSASKLLDFFNAGRQSSHGI